MGQISSEKRYFRIGEVSNILGVETHVLRFWEKEFPQIKPQRADSKHRTYQKKDVEILQEIKRLLYEEKMTIEGAKRRLREKKRSSKLSPDQQVLKSIKSDLLEILDIMT